MVKLKYKRVILKLSGEVLGGEKGFGIDWYVVEIICEEIEKVREFGVEVVIVVGGGNFFRGRSVEYIDRVIVDYMGMFVIVINLFVFQSIFEKRGILIRVQSVIEMRQIVELYIWC